MKIWLKSFSLVLATFLILFIGWMNLTPGHFRSSCGCSIEYGQEPMDEPFTSVDGEVLRLPGEICPAVICQNYIAIGAQFILVPLSLLDFNK